MHPIFEMVKKMPEPWRSHFPKSQDEALGWKPWIVHRGLSMKVLAVARTRIEAAWCAYIDAVPGINHEDEREEVLDSGSKLCESVARAIFPDFAGVPYHD